jgi:glycosyltransferase involved in cell wall biosynthesis
LLAETLQAVRSQRCDPSVAVELLVCDSGSRDGSVELARTYGAEVIEIAPERFSHGGTRNLLMERSHGEHVALLTQDSVPADEHWLARLLAGFSLTADVGLVFGPYVPRPDATMMVSRELTQWFRSFSPDGSPRVDRLAPEERSIPARALLGPRGFFTDANGCLSRAAWESVPFRRVPYAEDHFLAHDMLRAGYAKVFVPDARVVHSHEYCGRDWLRRSFDEARAIREIYGFVEPIGVQRTALKIWGLVGADWHWARAETASDPPWLEQISLMAGSLRNHLLRTAGAVLGARASRLPDPVVRRLSLERRGR